MKLEDCHRIATVGTALRQTFDMACTHVEIF